MNSVKHIALLALVALLLCTGFPAFAQSHADADTLLLEAGKLMYKDPAKSATIALQVYEDSGNNKEQQILSLILASNAYFSMKDSKEAKKYAFKALALAEKNNDYVNQVKVYGLIGNHYQVLKLNEKARFYLGKAEAIMQKHALPNDMRYLKGNIFAVKGNSYKNDLDCDFAITYFDKAIHEFKQATNTSAVNNLNMVQVQKGFCVLEKQLPNEAAAIFTNVLATPSAPKVYDIWVYAKIGLARSYYLQKNYAAAVAQLNDALEKNKSQDNVTIEHELYRNLSANYLQLNDDARYKLYNTLYHQTFKEVNDDETQLFSHLINEVSADAEIKIAEEHNTHRTYFIGLILIGLLAVVIPGIIVYKKQKKVSNLKKALFRKSLNR